jgi:lysyl-tRNA synthetase class 2
MWQPSASIETLKQRAAILKNIRQFFQDRNVLEVQTPSLSMSTITDPYIQAIEVPLSHQSYYLQTSPEYHMKRLLAAGSGDIFQICKSFRADEIGRLHNTEFSMLEWYRLGMNDEKLMDEIELLLHTVSDFPAVQRITYNDIFKKILNLDLKQASVEDLKQCAEKHSLDDPGWNDNYDAWLLYLFSVLIEPILQAPTFIYDFPATQASLARIKPNGCAARFELYIQGIELANGFWELTDPQEQAQRFEQDQKKRVQENLPFKPVDALFLQALESGLPDCAGVALGLDRLIMLALQKQLIDEVISFRF